KVRRILPAYRAGTATLGAGGFKTLQRFYGTDNITFTFISDEFNGVTRGADGQVRPVVTRTFHSFSQAAEENGQSRIYLGIHWSFDKVYGIQAGSAIADYAFATLLRPRSHHHGHDASSILLGPVSQSLAGSPLAAQVGDVWTRWQRAYDAGRLLDLDDNGPLTAGVRTPPGHRTGATDALFSVFDNVTDWFGIHVP